jgi:hypothetical protein
MNTILNTAISPFVLIMRRSGLLTEDLDYHLVRASMVTRNGGHMRRSGSCRSSATDR